MRDILSEVSATRRGSNIGTGRPLRVATYRPKRSALSLVKSADDPTGVESMQQSWSWILPDSVLRLYIRTHYLDVLDGPIAEFFMGEAHIDAAQDYELLDIMNAALLEGMEPAELGTVAVCRRARLRQVQLLG